ncbi:unnamed protein product [Didymodactylos carnosus]|uniref:Uncharacterized protein n=1 Tax=Didymodactylos carnosus TaxID=1234261 RepID=A0A813XH44_9BILA|nr:unnamed protein product [Didymodactylos carnosus]CAF0864753.1 unnamed protein product [Didymodactylos carnosus]CAF3597025.1 unnamed protein product [Didymodactylos carnosus]CAF3652290.1 unnamed protein product [Didymodactylos carnosus]
MESCRYNVSLLYRSLEMDYLKILAIFLIFTQIFQVAFARPSSNSRHDLTQSAYNIDLDDLSDNDLNDLTDYSSKSKKWIKFISNNNEDRRKKFLDSGHSLQGLWAMPGKR